MDLSMYKKYFPKNISDTVALCVLLGLTHAVCLFELFVVLPFVYRSHEVDFTYYIHLIVIFYLYVTVMSNLYKLIMTENGSAGLMLPVVLKEGWRFCGGCECNAPPRSHHCFICNKCVLKRDHHCSFTGNCVGFANQRYYIHMLGFMILSSFYFNILNFDYAYHTLEGFSFKTLFLMTLPIFAWVFNLSESVTVGSAFMTSLCLIGFMLSTTLFVYHMGNILRGQTTHESAYNQNIYNLGLKKNLMLSFGRNWKYCWISPFIRSPLIGDGTQFSNEELFESSKDM